MKRSSNASSQSHAKRARQIYEQETARRDAARQNAPSVAPGTVAADQAYATPRSTSDQDATSAGEESSSENGSSDNEPSNDDTAFVPDPYIVEMLEKCIAILTRKGRQLSKNICIQGAAGTGKSWFVRHLRSRLEALSMIVEVIAPSGSAALNVQGTTCDVLFGLTPTLRKEPLSRFVTKVLEGGLRAKLQRLQVLIIDEISMVSHEFLMQMDALLKEARRSTEPFGGVKVVVVGDFAQLPPVRPQQYCHVHGFLRVANKGGRRGILWCTGCERDAGRSGTSYDGAHPDDQWAFTAPIWSKLKFEPILLGKLLRQQDVKLKEIIATIFLGKELTTTQLSLLRRNTSVPVGSTRLYCKHEPKNEHNKACLREMDQPKVTFTALDNRSGNPPPYQRRFDDGMSPGTPFLRQLQDHRFEEKLTLCKDMPVLLVANINVKTGLVNGARGIVVDWQLVNAEDIPRSSDSLRVSGFMSTSGPRTRAGYLPSVMDGHWTRQRDRMRAFMQSEHNNGNPLPVVRFDNGIQQVIYPRMEDEDWADDDEEQLNVSTYMRTQIPLIPAWAITLHRAQGMTLPSCMVNLSNVFNHGLEYVGLSRCSTLEAMEVRGLGTKLKFGMDPVVAKFMRDTYPDAEAQMAQVNRAS